MKKSFNALKKLYQKKDVPFDIENLTVIAYRVGKLSDFHKRGVHFASSKKDAAAYADLHEGFNVKKYEIKLDKALIAGHQNSITRKFFNKSYNSFSGGVAGGRKLDRKIKKEAIKRGYSGIIYTRPAPPADMEVMVTSNPPGTITLLTSTSTKKAKSSTKKAKKTERQKLWDEEFA